MQTFVSLKSQHLPYLSRWLLPSIKLLSRLRRVALVVALGSTSCAAAKPLPENRAGHRNISGSQLTLARTYIDEATTSLDGTRRARFEFAVEVECFSGPDRSAADNPSALRLRERAHGGDPEAMYGYAHFMLLGGAGSAQEASEWLRKSAIRGSTIAMVRLAQVDSPSFRDDGWLASPAEVKLKWLREAHRLQSDEATLLLRAVLVVAPELRITSDP